MLLSKLDTSMAECVWVSKETFAREKQHRSGRMMITAFQKLSRQRKWEKYEA